MIALGAMSGTSTDGVDVAALHFTPQGQMRYLGMSGLAFEPQLQAELLRLQHLPPLFSPHEDPLLCMLTARRQLSLTYAQAARTLMDSLSLQASDVGVLGAHGQTVRHRPDLGFTYQMLDAALLSVELGLDVVHDFRSKDVALGGQGAPLVPAFHQAWLHANGVNEPCAVLNLGGFSNLTVLGSAGQAVQGGDCGPANCLMDFWAVQRFQQTMDRDGAIAASGQVDEALLACMWQHPFFARDWPKSTGRDEFSTAWLHDCLNRRGGLLSDVDVMATLLALSVKAVVTCLPQGVKRVFVCGGGVYNPVFMRALAAVAPSCVFSSMDALGLPAQAVEACAFAWMAVQTLHQQHANCIGVTGAKRRAVLGSLQRFV